MPTITQIWRRFCAWLLAVVLAGAATAGAPSGLPADAGATLWSATDQGGDVLIASFDAGAKVVRAPTAGRAVFTPPPNVGPGRATLFVASPSRSAITGRGEAAPGRRASLVGVVELRI